MLCGWEAAHLYVNRTAAQQCFVHQPNSCVLVRQPNRCNPERARTNVASPICGENYRHQPKEELATALRQVAKHPAALALIHLAMPKPHFAWAARLVSLVLVYSLLHHLPPLMASCLSDLRVFDWGMLELE